MNLRLKIAGVVYLLNALVLLAFGLMYTTSRWVMPYHQKIIDLDAGPPQFYAKLLMIGLLKGAGAGFLASAVCVFGLLFFPFRKAERWALYLIPCSLLIVDGILCWVTLSLKGDTGIDTPWQLPVSASVLIVASIFSTSFNKKPQSI